jgi:arylsulfatase A-like enzyme
MLGLEVPEEAERETIRQAYRAEVRYFDLQLRTLITALRRQGLLERTTLILTADHGESLLERGYFSHGYSVNHEETEVPLIVFGNTKLPQGKVADELVTLLDLNAYIASLFGLPVPDPGPIAAVVAGTAPPAAPAICDEELDGRRLVSVRNDRWLLMYDFTENRKRLIDTVADPGELQN